MGLLDGISGLDYWIDFFHPKMGSVVDHSSQGRFFSPNWGSVVQRSSQGRLFFVVTCTFSTKGHIWSTSMISGPDFVIFHEFCILQS